MNTLLYNPNNRYQTFDESNSHRYPSIGRYFDSFFSDSQTPSTHFVPRVDIAENDKIYSIYVEVPGMKKEDFNIALEDRYLTVKGKRELSSEQKKENFHSLETRYGSFNRRFMLPENIERSKIKARYNNGLLELTVPKDKTQKASTTIEVS